jgi:predicted permease
VVQIACALVLSACGMLMVRTLVNRAQVDLGYDPRGAVRADLALPPDRYAEPATVRALADDLLARLEREPGVAAAGASTWALPTAAGAQRQFSLPAARDATLSPAVRRGVDAVTPGYFEALGVPLDAGRSFTRADAEGAAPVAIVNGELAQHLWPNQSPLGQELRLGSLAENAPVVTIVGVVRTTRRSAMHDVPVARVYLPFAQYPNGTLTLVVRAPGNAERTLQAAVAASDPALLVEGVRTVEADIAQFVAPVRLMASLLAGFGVVGLLLAGTGVFGMMSYAVAQREQELAVRSALGANRADLFRLVFGSALRVTGIGLVVGAGIALAATRALSAFLYGVGPGDPVTMALVVAFLTIVSLVACYAPARAAAAADPMSLLRR